MQRLTRFVIPLIAAFVLLSPAPSARGVASRSAADGAGLDLVSDTVTRREPLDAGREVWLREIEDAAGTRTYNLEFGPHAVWLHATTYALRGLDARVMQLTPPVAILRDPTDLGHRWAELTVREGELTEYAFEVVWRGPMNVLGAVVADCIAVEHLVDGHLTITSFYCPGWGPVASVTSGSLGADSFLIRDELVAQTTGRLAYDGCEPILDGWALGFDIDGFAAGEALKIGLTSPTGVTFTIPVMPKDAPSDGEPTGADILMVMTPGMAEGTYLVTAASASVSAWYVIRWNGGCP